MKEKAIRHPSYGTITLTKSNWGGKVSLFGSSIKHSNSVRMEIKRAYKNRDLNQDWIHGDEMLLLLEMSPSQFADLITSFGSGGRTPCTLRWTEKDGAMPECPDESRREVFQKEFSEDVREMLGRVEDLVSKSKEILSQAGPIKVGDRKQLLNALEMLQQRIKDDMPFVYRQFNEAMEKTITEAKREIEAFFSSTITRMGLDAMEKQIAGETIPAPPQIEDPVIDTEFKEEE